MITVNGQYGQMRKFKDSVPQPSKKPRNCVLVGKPDYVAEIIEILKNSRFGLNLNAIVEKLGCSRTTATKYLKILETEGEIVDRDIGQYRIWLHKDVFFRDGKQKIPSNTLIYQIYNSLLRNTQNVGLKPADIKKLGTLVAEDFNLSEFIDQTEFPGVEALLDFSSLAEFLMKTLDSIFRFFDEYTWQPPVLMADKGQIILRLANSHLIAETPAHFHFIAGIIEHEIQKHGNGTVDVIQVREEDQVVDFLFQFADFLDIQP